MDTYNHIQGDRCELRVTEWFNLDWQPISTQQAFGAG